ncbi:MAG: TatD family hydrolase, partial [Clostridia bacterium]|nr:TatD family hydrolase [Clostridia bacterium]
MTAINLFDTHAHLNEPELAKDLPGVLERAHLAGVSHIATIGYDWQSSLYAVYLAEKHKHIHAVVGIHPHDAQTLTKEIYQRLAELAQSPKVVAIGEIGLDYYRDLSPREAQKKAFIEQIHLAQDLHKPIVIHDRDAHADLMKIVRKEKAGVNGGIMHCYSGSWEMAKEAINLGFYISIAGPVTYKNARALPEV